MPRFGTWAPLAANWASQPRMSQVDIISLHTMVGSLAGTDAMFRRNGFGGTFSHFGIGGNGECTQWQDTAYRAAANYNGNWHIISVECADIGAPFPAWNTSDGNAVPAFSDAQIETLARLIAAIAPAHNIPIVLIPDARPGRRGIGYHRQGVPGYMVAGAEQWSTARGKVCPGNRRIAQIPQVIQLAQGADMPLTQADADLVANAIFGRQFPRAGTKSDGSPQTGPTNLAATIAWLDSNFSGLAAAIGRGSADPKSLADAIVANLTAVDAEKVAALVLAGLNGAQLSVNQSS